MLEHVGNRLVREMAEVKVVESSVNVLNLWVWSNSERTKNGPIWTKLLNSRLIFIGRTVAGVDFECGVILYKRYKFESRHVLPKRTVSTEVFSKRIKMYEYGSYLRCFNFVEQTTEKQSPTLRIIDIPMSLLIFEVLINPTPDTQRPRISKNCSYFRVSTI